MVDYKTMSTHALKIIKLKCECELLRRSIKDDSLLLSKAEKELFNGK